MGLVDAHCHFDFPAFDGHRDEILAESTSPGIERIVIPGVRQHNWDRVMATARSHPALYYCLGIHPWYVDEHAQDALDELKRRLGDRPERCVALGECGLDRLHGDLLRQRPWFEAQVEMARDLDWPLVIHSVKSHDVVAATLVSRRFSGDALVHGFSGSYEQARKLVDLGCKIGIGGVITHERARKTRSTVARLPLDALVLETDAPDMAPVGVEKGRNSPLYLSLIFNALAGLRRESAEHLQQALRTNVDGLYRWH